MFGLIACIILLIIISSKYNNTNEKARERAHFLYDNTDIWREQELFHKFLYQRKRVDGSSIPLDYSYVSIWNEVDKQLKKEGLRLSPSTCNLSNYKFDDKGYVITPYKKW
ncbi:hypothetical protein RASY3_14775 [Ruminococcus albus SY3]|uniref:Uncharacterized protein n=1 Tax=Ruminococcus albus SY3 TaxID=1341156 RepID=A0A011WNL5_RUMAL|nr:hypothetical protein [Ruminococcus albus]EXM38570.1 hypothetical protein RASY3_14775 [Ruminococcus albus SY3]